MSRIRAVLMVIGVIGILAGGYFLATAHVAKPVEVDGHLQHFYIHTTNGSYTQTEVILNEDASQSYTFNEKDFTPVVPEQAIKDGTVNLWVDQGTTHVLAITLYDDQDQNPTKYVSAYYTNPQKQQSDGYTNGGISGGIGLVLLVIGFFLRGKKAVPAQASVGAPTVPPAQR